MKRMIFIAETRPDNQVIRQELTPIPASDAAADNADNNASVRGESGRGEVRDDVDVDDIAMLLRGGGTRVHDGYRASGAEATPAAGPRADYRLRLTLDQWTPDGAVSGEITDITRLRLRFRSDYGTVTALDGSAVPQTQDLFRPLLLAVHRDDRSGIAGSSADTSRVVISVVTERLDTPCASPTRLTRPAGGACVSSPTLNSHTNAGRSTCSPPPTDTASGAAGRSTASPPKT